MIFKSTLIKNFTLAILLAMAGNIQAQVFWSEDFSGGFPAGWTSEDISANYDTEWTWCEGPTDPPPAGCSPIFSGAPNGQVPFQATTAENGFLTLNSDAVATDNHANDPHISVLTTDAIDCSAESVVWLKFETHIGAFELDPLSNAILRVSNNNMDWTEYTLFPGLTTTIRWSDNPFDAIVNISDVAANQSTVYLQLEWTAGWEYFWNVDDMILTTEDPTPPNNLRVMDNFFAGAPSARTPVSQVRTFGFLADIENQGSAPQPNTVLTVEIEDDANPGTVIFTDALSYGTTVADSLYENVPFEGAGFTPADMVATYTGTYTITSDSVDIDPSDNSLEFNFEITENLFASDRGVTSVFGSAVDNWEDGENYSWAYGNSYHVVNGDGWWADKVTFGIGNADETGVEGKTIAVKLYEWDDADADGIAIPEERTEVGFNNYDITGDEGTGEGDLITIPLLGTLSLEPGVELDDDTDYIVMLEYNSLDQETTISFVGSDEYDYGAQSLRMGLLGEAASGTMLAVGHPLTSEDYSSGGFGGGANTPIARLTIVDEMPTNTTELASENVINVFPSPASNHIDVALDFTELQEELTFRIVDVTGKAISHRSVENAQKENYRFDVSTFPAGNYFLNVSTSLGNRSIPFTVAR
ncbi:MAG: T9SS type A sorting domain-containing protein [Saprospiraceae bacterium]